MREPPTAPAALKQMRQAVRAFYLDAVSIGQHQWVEHAGLMNEHLTMLVALYESGGCIWENTPPMALRHARYLGEKINCMFGECFAKYPEAFEAFVKAAKGEK